MKIHGTAGIWTFVACVVGATAVASAAEQVAPGPGNAVGEAETRAVRADEPQRHFQEAREEFLKRDLKTAAVEIRKGAALLRLEAAGATRASQDALEASAKELDNLAGKVESGEVTAASNLDPAFARAEQALASEHLTRAKESWAKKDLKRTGEYLNAATISLEHACAWAGRKEEAGVAAATRDASVVAEKLIQGAGWAVGETENAIKAVGTEIERLGRALSIHERLD